MLIYTHFLNIFGSVKIPKLDENTLKNIHTSYYEKLNTNLSNIYENKNLVATLVDDIEPEKNIGEDEQTVIVLDIGGTHFKIARVTINSSDGKLSYKLQDIKKYSYPTISPKSKLIFWFDWVAELYISYLIETDCKPDICSLIFSYPIRYSKDGTNMAWPIKLNKFWCFESKISLSMDIFIYLNNAVQSEAKKLGLDDDLYAKIGSVLNDSVATLFSSKIISDSNGVAIILGTGTNCSFFVNRNLYYSAYNTEWASFTSSAICLLEEEKYLLSILKSYNILDVICGNGYKTTLLNIFNYLKNLKLPNLIGDQISEILSRSDDSVHKSLLIQLFTRSRKILAALTSAVIRKSGFDDIVILLNGTGFSDPMEREKFISDVRYLLKLIGLENIKIRGHYEEGLTFIGAAYYGFCKHLMVN